MIYFSEIWYIYMCVYIHIYIYLFIYICIYIVVVVVLFYKNMGLRNRIETWSVDYLLLCSSGWAADFGGSSCLIAFICTSHSC